MEYHIPTTTVTNSKALVTTSDALVPSSVALVTTSKALVTSSDGVSHPHYNNVVKSQLCVCNLVLLQFIQQLNLLGLASALFVVRIRCNWGVHTHTEEFLFLQIGSRVLFSRLAGRYWKVMCCPKAFG